VTSNNNKERFTIGDAVTAAVDAANEPDRLGGQDITPENQTEQDAWLRVSLALAAAFRVAEEGGTPAATTERLYVEVMEMLQAAGPFAGLKCHALMTHCLQVTPKTYAEFLAQLEDKEDLAAAREHIDDDTVLAGIVCKRCKKVLPPHTVAEHLDENHAVHQCHRHGEGGAE